jgi:ferritin-like metal-binding protein YciE
MSLVNPRDLLLHQLSELLWIERTLFAEVLPALHDAAHDPELQLLLTTHRSETREHCVRLEAAIRAAGAEPAAARSATLEAAARQHEEEAKAITSARLADLFHCGGAARTEHLELGAYDAAILLAGGECRTLLRRNRDEDARALGQAERLAARLARLGGPGEIP